MLFLHPLWLGHVCEGYLTCMRFAGTTASVYSSDLFDVTDCKRNLSAALLDHSCSFCARLLPVARLAREILQMLCTTRR